MKISMILPIYNESSTIDGMMDQLRALPGDWEILFADGGSRDGTVQRIGTEFPVLKSPKGRAAQMNDGAARASGEILWFVHCDSRLPEDAHSQIRRRRKREPPGGASTLALIITGRSWAAIRFFPTGGPDGALPLGTRAYGSAGSCSCPWEVFRSFLLWRTMSFPYG